MTVLIGITGEQKPASALVDVLEVIKALDIDVFFGDYARAVVRAGGLPVWIPVDTPLEIIERLDELEALQQRRPFKVGQDLDLEPQLV